MPASRTVSTWLRAGAALLLVAVSLALTVVAPAERADAAVIRPFTTVFSQQTNGSIQVTGNTVFTCGATAACQQAQTGAVSSSNNNFTMVPLDTDADATTTRSSSANLTIPPGARVLHAGLYWGGARTAGTGGTAATGTVGNMRFRTPGAASYTTLTAQQLDNQTSSTQDYSAYRNVTDLVRSAGAGTYWGADISAATGVDRYAGWSLVVALEDPAAPLRDLTIFNGYATVVTNENVDTTISGFLAPPSGAVGARFGSVTYEGDAGITGDYFQVGTNRLADAQSPSANFFGSRITSGGANLANRNPASLNNLGLDAKVVDAPGVIPNGATSANLRFASTGDFFYPAALTTQIDLYAPTIQGTKSVTNLSGNAPAKVGDVLEYTLTFSNTGDDAATGAVLTDALPTGTTFVPGSLRVTAGANQGAKTDAAGDDQGEYDAATRTVRLRAGTGATAAAGGRLAPSATTTATFRVRVDTQSAGTTLRNTGVLTYRAETIGRDYTYSTAEVATPVAEEADVSLTKSGSPETVLAGNQVSYTLTARNAGPSTASAVQVVDTLPEGVTLVSSTPSSGACSAASGTLTCDVGAIASGGTATVTVVVRVPPGSVATTLTNVARVSAATSDPDPGNNNASATTAVTRQADVGLTKSASPTNPVPGTAVTYTLVATNNGASRAAGVTVTDSLPSGLSVRSATTDRGTCEVTGTQVACTAAGLDPGESATVTVVADVPSGAPSTALTNSARVVSTTPDPDASNNTASVTVTPQAPRADLVVTKQTVTSPLVAGRPVRHLVTVRNDGPSDATEVTLDDPVPAAVTGVSATPSAGSCTVDAGRVRCDLGLLPAGRSVQVAIDGDLAPGATGTLANSATASSPTTDPAPGNNTGTSSAPVTASADLAVTKSAGPVTDGAVATYSIVVTNNGPSVARSVTVVDDVPAPLTYQGSSSDPGICSVAAATVTCAVGDLAPGASATVTVRAQTPANGSGRGATNTARTSSPTPDPVGANNSASYTLPTSSQADVTLAKTVSPSPVVAGETVTYQLTARNAGPSDATGVTVTDTIGARVTGVSASTTTPGATCAATAGNDVSCTAPSLASGATFVVTITGSVVPGASAGALANDAAVSSTTPIDPTLDNNTASATVEVVRSADVSVTKTGTDTVAAGEEGEWSLVVRNDGPSTATDVQLTDSLPSGVTFSGASGATCSAERGVVSCPIGTLAPGAETTVTVRGTFDAGLLGGVEQVNTASVSSSTNDPDPADNTDDQPVTLTEESDVSVTKEAVPATLVPGAESLYVLTVSNDGPSDARDVVLSDDLDADLTLVEATIEGGACTVSGQTVTCRRDLLPAGASATARIRVLVDADRRTPLANTAEVTSSSDSTPDDNASSVTSPVAPSADLTVVKTASDDQVAAGEGVTYTLTVVNNGPSLASAVDLTDDLPEGVVPASATTTAGTCAITGQQLACDLGDVEPGAPVTVTVVAGTTPGAATGPRQNRAEVSSPTADPTPGNNTARATVDVVAEADVQLTKTASSESVVPGRPVSWTIVVNNAGPSTARGIVVTDTVPGAVTITSAFHGTATPCAVAGQQVTCDLGDRPPGQRVISITGTLASSYAGAELANTARVETTTTDPAPGNNAATATSGISRISDLEIVKTVDDPTPVAGQRITYTLAVRNNGPSDALNPQLIDQLPSGLTDVVIRTPTLQGQPATAECELRQPVNPGTVDNPAAPTVFCNGPVFRANLPEAVIGSVTATVAPGFTGTLTNTGRVSSDTIDRAADNNESSVATVIGASADVSVDKALVDGPPVPGERVAWTITADNAGPSTARSLVVTDDVDDALTGVTATVGGSAAPCTVGQGNLVTCALGDLGLQGNPVVALSADVPADFTGTLVNTAEVSSTTPDPDPANNSDTVTTTPTGSADVAITKTLVTDPPVPGEPVSWRLLVTNSGPSVARDVVVTDDLPDALTSVTATTGATPNPCSVGAGGVVTCDLDDLPAGGAGSSVAITIAGELPEDFRGALDNIATVDSATDDPDPSDNSDSAAGTAAPAADVSVVKSITPLEPVPGEDVTFSLVVTNNGPSTARDVVLTDDVADALTGVTAGTGAAPNPCTVAGGTGLVRCELGDLPATGADATVVVTISGSLPEDYTGALSNTADVSTTTADPVPGNDSDTVSGTAAPVADVAVTKTLTTTPPVPGSEVSWSLVVTNTGPSTARGVVVTDDVPVAVTELRAPSACTVGTDNAVTCELGTLADGASETITLTGTLDADFEGALSNTARVASSTDDADPSDNEATSTDAAAPDANVGIVKTVSPGNPVPGQPVEWTLVVTNTGPSVARDVVVSDDVDDRITDLTASSPCTVGADNQVTCELGDLAPSDDPVAVITLTGGVPADLDGPLSNTATVSSPTDTDTPGNDSSTAEPATAPGADLRVVKTASTPTPAPGGTITWTVTVTNGGPSVAQDVVITDDVADALTGVTASAPCTVGADNAVRCEVGDLATTGAGATATVTISGRLPATFTGDLPNTASVASDTPDADPSDDSDTVVVTAEPRAGVSVAKGVSPASPVPGADVTWTVTVSNAGPSVARDVVLTDDVVDEISGLRATVGGADACTIGAGNAVRCELGTLAAPDTVVITLVGRVPAGFTGDLDNTAVVAAPDDTDASDNSATAEATADPRAAVSIAKSLSGDEVVPGDTVTWTLTAANGGPSVARDVVVTDDVLDALTDVTATTGQGAERCTVGAGNAVTCALGDLGPATSQTITVSGRLPADYSGEVDNTATIASPTDVTTGDDSASTDDTAVPRADVGVTKSLRPAAPVPGEEVAWTVAVSNNGPSVARDVVVTDDVPDAVTDVTVSADGDPDRCTVGTGNAVTCELGDLAPSGAGSVATITITATLPADFTGDLTNTASVDSATPDDNADNDESTAAGTSDPRADVRVAKSVDPGRPVAGQDVTWTVVVTNDGPSVARDVTVSDEVVTAIRDLTATADSDPDACTVSTDNVVTCDLGDLPTTGDGAEVVVTLTGRVPATYAGALDNTATVASPTDDTPGNNSATADATVDGRADVSITKTASTSAPVPGERTSWDVRVANAGPSVARDVVLTDDLPDDLTDVTVSGGGGTCTVTAGNSVRCEIGVLAVDASTTVTISGVLPAGHTGAVDNTARVTSPTDTTPDNNQASTTGTAAPRADVSIDKAMSPARPVAGEDVTFTLVVRNDGPSTARDVVVSDTLIDALSARSAVMTDGGSCDVAGQRVTCTLPRLAPGTAATVTLVAAVAPAHTGQVTNVASVSAATPDPDETDNVDQVSEGPGSGCESRPGARVQVCPDVRISKTASVGRAAPGDRVTYTITVSNAGPSAATDVRVVDALDEDLTLVSAEVVEGAGETSTTDGRLTALLGSLAPGASCTLRLVAVIDDDAVGKVPNVAVASTSTPDAGSVQVQDGAVVDVLAEDGTDGGSDGGSDGDGAGDTEGDDGVLPDTGLPAGVVPLTALSVLLLALGLWLVRRSRVSGGR